MNRRGSGAVVLVAVVLAITGWAPRRRRAGIRRAPDAGRAARPAGRVELQHHHAAGAPRGTRRQGLPDGGGSGRVRAGDGGRAGGRTTAPGVPRRLQPVLVPTRGPRWSATSGRRSSSTRPTGDCPRCSPACRRARWCPTTAAWWRRPRRVPSASAPAASGTTARRTAGWPSGASSASTPARRCSRAASTTTTCSSSRDPITSRSSTRWSTTSASCRSTGRTQLASGVRQWMGSSRGHWEGDTLVVTTTNFTDRTAAFNTSVISGVGMGDGLHLVERFTRVDADTLLYEFTVDDPATYTRPFTVAVPMTRTDAPIFEYACHEGNYGLLNIPPRRARGGCGGPQKPGSRRTLTGIALPRAGARRRAENELGRARLAPLYRARRPAETGRGRARLATLNRSLSSAWGPRGKTSQGGGQPAAQRPRRDRHGLGRRRPARMDAGLPPASVRPPSTAWMPARGCSYSGCSYNGRWRGRRTSEATLAARVP